MVKLFSDLNKISTSSSCDEGANSMTSNIARRVIKQMLVKEAMQQTTETATRAAVSG